MISISAYSGIRCLLTVCCFVEDDETCVDQGGEFSLLPFYRIGMAAQAISRLVEIDIVVRTIQSPQSTNTGRAAANDGDLLPGHPVSRRCHRFLYNKRVLKPKGL